MEKGQGKEGMDGWDARLALRSEVLGTRGMSV